MNEPSKNDRVLGGLWGSIVGDALGVPVEFMDRSEVQENPVLGMRGQGRHRQPPGTWSDDSSLLLCSVDSLISHNFDSQDMGKRFLAWYREELWTPWGKVFDVGVATAEALVRISRGMRAEVAGGDGQFSNGNGSLMRILPVVLRFAHSSTTEMLAYVHRASAITHRHPRSQMACGLYALLVRELLNLATPHEAFSKALSEFRAFYEPDPWWSAEFESFQLLLAGDLAIRPETEIDSGGYVMETLTASIWCLLTTNSFEECVLKAVNLGRDTDTTGCVTGGLAGITYGLDSIPAGWISQLARCEDLDHLFNQFSELVVNGQKEKS